MLSFVYPKYYKKNLHNRFFDLYDPAEHTHVMLEDLDHEAVEMLSTQFLKTICDEAGFPVDQKYKTPQLARTTVLVTSNFTINQLISQSTEANVFGKRTTSRPSFVASGAWMVVTSSSTLVSCYAPSTRLAS